MPCQGSWGEEDALPGRKSSSSLEGGAAAANSGSLVTVQKHCGKVYRVAPGPPKPCTAALTSAPQQPLRGPV
jgi:hypothetical protein